MTADDATPSDDLPGWLESELAWLYGLPPGEQRTALETLCRAHPQHADLARRVFRGMAHLDAQPPPTRNPTSIGPYRVLSMLGQGGMGSVYLVEQEQPIRRRVALKVIRAGMDSREVVARFEAERQALAALDHPGIAKIFEAGNTPEGLPFFVMEYVPGEPITKYCTRHRLNVADRLRLFVQVCDAVAHAHARGIVHRDIKPQNVLAYDQDGKPGIRIIDFGVAKAIDQPLTERALLTETGQMIGTPEYMSPEQARGARSDIDARTDVYALGVLLYELLVGVPPFDSRALRELGFLELVRRICEVDPPQPSRRVSSGGAETEAVAAACGTTSATHRRLMVGDLDCIVMMAMRKEPSRRYPSAAALATDVRRHLDGVTPIARAYVATAGGLRVLLATSGGALLVIALWAALGFFAELSVSWMVLLVGGGAGLSASAAGARGTRLALLTGLSALAWSLVGSLASAHATEACMLVRLRGELVASGARDRFERWQRAGREYAALPPDPAEDTMRTFLDDNGFRGMSRREFEQHHTATLRDMQVRPWVFDVWLDDEVTQTDEFMARYRARGPVREAVHVLEGLLTGRDVERLALVLLSAILASTLTLSSPRWRGRDHPGRDGVPRSGSVSRRVRAGARWR